jgi:hypothetical protein
MRDRKFRKPGDVASTGQRHHLVGRSIPPDQIERAFTD